MKANAQILKQVLTILPNDIVLELIALQKQDRTIPIVQIQTLMTKISCTFVEKADLLIAKAEKGRMGNLHPSVFQYWHNRLKWWPTCVLL